MLPRRSMPSGFSLAEILVCIAIIGILAAIAIPQISNVTDATQQTQAEAIKENLNGALKLYSQTQHTIRTAPDPSSSADEFLVLRSLQYKPPMNAISLNAAAPYYKQNWNPVESSNTADWRVFWNGATFSLLAPGAPGVGLKISFDGSDMNTNYTYPNNYRPQ